jgi:L-iditol 2-dehydrogenase
MRMAVLNGPERFDLVEEPVPAIAPDEVLLKVAACGVCASELDMFRGQSELITYPWQPGHEVSGVVEQAGGQVDTLARGDAVAAWVTTRGYADYVAVKAAYCFPSGSVPLEEALGEPMACVVNAVELADVAPGDDVVIIGAGFMGHLVQQVVQLRGPRQVIVADTRDDALKMAEALGATRTVNVLRDSLVDAVADATQGRGADVSFEVTGVQQPLDVIGEVTRMSGTVVLAGYHQGPSRTLPLAEWNWMAFRIANAHFRDVGVIIRGMERGMRLLTSGRIFMGGLVTHRYPLEEIGAAFEAAIEKPEGFVKATVMP